MSDDKHFQGVNDLCASAVVTNLTAVTRSIHELGDESELSLQYNSTEEFVSDYILWYLPTLRIL